MLHWKPKLRRCDALDLAATWPWAAPHGGFPVSELAQFCCSDAAEHGIAKIARDPIAHSELDLRGHGTDKECD